VFTHKLEVHTCDLNVIVKGEGLLKVASSHLHWKIGNISEMMLDRYVVTAGHYLEVILVYGLFNSSSCYDLEYSLIPLLQAFSSVLFCICGTSPIPSESAELLVFM